MKWFFNLKIRTKILMSSIFIALFTAVVGYEGITALKSADESDKVLYKNNLVPLKYLVNLSTNFQEVHNYSAEIQLVSSAEERSDLLNKIASTENEVDDSITGLEKTILFDEVRTAFSAVKKNYDSYKSALQSYINAYIAQNDQQAKLLWSSLRRSKLSVQNSIANFSDILDRRAMQRGKENILAVDSSVNFMTIVVILSVFIAMGVGIFISRVISKPLTDLTLTAGKLALGETDIIVTSTTNDEIGKLQKSFSEMIEKIKLQAEAAVKIAKGDLSVNIAAKSDKDILTHAMNKVIESLRKLSAETDILIKSAVAGELDRRSNAGQFEGAYKEIIEGFNQTLDAVIKPVQDCMKVLEIMSTGDFSSRVKEDYEGQHKLLKESVNKLGDSMVNILRDVSDAIQAVASASNQISSSTEELAAGAEEQSAQSNEIAAAVNEMTATITQTTKHASNAADNSKTSLELASVGNNAALETVEGMKEISQVVNRTGKTIKELGKSSDQIGEIVQVIDDIADQTNLLALNAAIEAARAGEQGRGFAVVADEVRQLAERTTKATKEIAEMIKKIQKDTNEAVVSMEYGVKEVERGKELAVKAGNALEKIIVSVQHVNDVISQVAAASEEQSATAEQISRNIESINNVTRESAAGTQQIARAAEELNKLTDNLQNLINKFNIGIVEKKQPSSAYAVRSNGKLVAA